MPFSVSLQGGKEKGNGMTTSSARLMLFAQAQEVLGTQEAEVLTDMLTPGEALSESKRSTDPFIQGFYEDIRLAFLGFEECLANHIVNRLKRLMFIFIVPSTVLNVALTAIVLYK